MQKLPKSPYKDILVISTGFLILFLIAHIKEWRPILKQVFLGIAVAVPVLSLLSSFLAEKIVWGWFKLAQGLGYINSRILLSVIFFVFLTPLALLSRLKKSDSLQLKKSDGSYFTTRNHAYEKKDLEKMW